MAFASFNDLLASQPLNPYTALRFKTCETSDKMLPEKFLEQRPRAKGQGPGARVVLSEVIELPDIGVRVPGRSSARVEDVGFREGPTGKLVEAEGPRAYPSKIPKIPNNSRFRGTLEENGTKRVGNDTVKDRS